MGQSPPLFCLFSSFFLSSITVSISTMQIVKCIDGALGIRTRATGWQAQTKPRSYGGAVLIMPEFRLMAIIVQWHWRLFVPPSTSELSLALGLVASTYVQRTIFICLDMHAVGLSLGPRAFVTPTKATTKCPIGTKCI